MTNLSHLFLLAMSTIKIQTVKFSYELTLKKCLSNSDKDIERVIFGTWESDLVGYPLNWCDAMNELI